MIKEEIIERYGEEEYQRRLEYNRQRYQQNRNKIKERYKKYYQQHKDEMKQYSKQYSKQHKEEIKECHKKYIRKHNQMFAYCIPEEWEQIENYELAKKDDFNGWCIHHRLETHNSDGEKRLVNISVAELVALDMYYNRPANELVFLTNSEHAKLHRK